MQKTNSWPTSDLQRNERGEREVSLESPILFFLTVSYARRFR